MFGAAVWSGGLVGACFLLLATFAYVNCESTAFPAGAAAVVGVSLGVDEEFLGVSRVSDEMEMGGGGLAKSSFVEGCFSCEEGDWFSDG